MNFNKYSSCAIILVPSLTINPLVVVVVGLLSKGLPCLFYKETLFVVVVDIVSNVVVIDAVVVVFIAVAVVVVVLVLMGLGKKSDGKKSATRCIRN